MTNTAKVMARIGSKRFWFLSVGIILLASITAGFSWLERADHILLDTQFRLLRQLAPAAIKNDVVVVGMDEATFKQLREPFALWHPHLGKFLQAMALAKPAVLGLDVILPDRSFQFINPSYDQSLLHGLLALKTSQVPIVLGQSLDDNGQPRQIFAPYRVVAGDKALASVMVCMDSDGVVRWAGSRACKRLEDTATLSGAMAEHLGVKAAQYGLIDYSIGKEMDYVPFTQVLDWLENADIGKLHDTFGNRPVLLGVTVQFDDRLRMPVPLAAWEPGNKNVPGVLVHAQNLRSLITHGLIQEASRGILLLVCSIAALCWFGRTTRLKLLLLTGLIVVTYVMATWLLSLGYFLPVASVVITAVSAAAARTAWDGWEHAHEKRTLQASFGSYVSPEIMKHIVSGEIKPGLGGERRKVCVLFSDVRDFTTRSEGMPPEALIQLLNRYFSQMTLAIHNHDGTLDKFIGDGIMAFFGAPQQLDDPVRHALAAAREMMQRLHELNTQLTLEGVAPIKIGIGLHYGEAVIGHVGSETRHEYTAIGDVVNLAARLEGLSKEAGYPIVCSVAVADKAGSIELQEIGMRAIKGRSSERVFGWNPSVV